MRTALPEAVNNKTAVPEFSPGAFARVKVIINPLAKPKPLSSVQGVLIVAHHDRPQPRQHLPLIQPLYPTGSHGRSPEHYSPHRLSVNPLPPRQQPEASHPPPSCPTSPAPPPPCQNPHLRQFPNPCPGKHRRLTTFLARLLPIHLSPSSGRVWRGILVFPLVETWRGGRGHGIGQAGMEAVV